MSIQFKRGLEENLPNGKAGEPLYVTDTKALYVGNGENTKPTLIGPVYDINSGNNIRFWIGTQTEYDALGEYEDDVAYIIKEE